MHQFLPFALDGFRLHGFPKESGRVVRLFLGQLFLSQPVLKDLLDERWVSSKVSHTDISTLAMEVALAWQCPDELYNPTCIHDGVLASYNLPNLILHFV